MKTTLLTLITSFILLLSGMQVAVAQEVSGTILDSETDETLPGVNILVKNTDTGTTTDEEGLYQLTVPSLNDTLVFSFIGYQTREVPINGRTEINIRMEPRALSGEEVVVIGYGTQRRKDLTGSVSSVSSEEIERVNPVRIEEALQGSSPGVFVQKTNLGEPGAGIKVRIRGEGSINAGNDPLYVIDGVPIQGGLDMLNPNEIESIEVLKDASATAIYGARGSNGVVLITTQSGQREEARVQFKSYYGTQQVRRYIPTLNGEEFARYINEMNKNDGDEPLFPNPEQYGEGTDWQQAVFGSAPIQNYQLSFSGGSESTSYRVTGNYQDQEGIAIGSGFERGSFKINLNSEINEKLRVGTNMNLIRALKNNSNLPEARAIKMPPILPVRDENGEYTTMDQALPYLNPRDNPVALAREQTSQNKSVRGLGSFFAEYMVIPNLQIETRFDIDYTERRGENYTPTTLISGANVGGSASLSESRTVNWVTENTLNYQNTFADRHRLNLLGGITAQEVTSEVLIASARDFVTDYFQYNNLGAGADPRPPNSNKSEYSLLSYIGRANYTYDDRYLLTLTGRVDGSSRFGSKNKYGFFPSGALAWRLSEEAFMQNVDFISNFKLRVSFGITGNQEIGNYLSLAQLGPSTYVFGDQRVSGIGPRTVPNPDLKWERAEQMDIGLDIGLRDDRINFTVDYYRKTTKDLLLSANLPHSTGFSSSTQNIGSVLNEGLELALNMQNSFGEFKWDINANFSTNRNEVLDLGPDTEEIIVRDRFSIIGADGIIKEGYPLGMYYTYVSEGFWQSQEEIDEVGTMPFARPGDERFKDLNGDGVFNNADRDIVGQPQPDFFYGLTNTFNFRGFDLSVILQGVNGNTIFNNNHWFYKTPNGGGNISRDATDYWSPDNKDASFPIPSRSTQSRASTRWIEDGTYLRVKNLTLGYQLPSTLLSQAGIRNARIYITAQNPFTFTEYTGYDPEVNKHGGNVGMQGWGKSAYPATKTYTLGLNITF